MLLHWLILCFQSETWDSEDVKKTKHCHRVIKADIYNVRWMVIQAFLCYYVCLSEHNEKVPEPTVGNNLQVWAEWHCQIHPHISTKLLGPRSLLAYRTHPRPTTIHSKSWINQRITSLIYINTKCSFWSLMSAAWTKIWLTQSLSVLLKEDLRILYSSLRILHVGMCANKSKSTGCIHDVLRASSLLESIYTVIRWCKWMTDVC